MSMNNAYKIRPAGRHLLTIGRELIQDPHAALVELVKNAYDADSPDVQIVFCATHDRGKYTITISDRGHGMSKDTVINKWLVPSTDDKLGRKESPGGRKMQGRKGIGRFAAAILGDDLLLETVTPTGEKTTVLIVWRDFESANYLDQVEILVESGHSSAPQGTRLTITGESAGLAKWDRKEMEKLHFELKKLISPIKGNNESAQAPNEDSFAIAITIDNILLDQTEPITETVEPYPIFELYDYRIAGTIAPDGKGVLTYSCQKVRNAATEKIDFDYGSSTRCGQLVVDIRVYDREKEAIESLIERGLKDEAGKYFSKMKAKQLLDTYNGIGVYRNGFRIRPLGDPEFDWLTLNEQRIQNPSMRIGGNQVIGYVLIEPEELSGLTEKSARDGLHEGEAFESLKKVTKLAIGELEKRRFNYRQKAGLSRPALKLEKELEKLFSYEEVKKGIRERFLARGGTPDAAEEIISILTKDEAERNRLVEDIRQAVAIYQGQATLGKIINVIRHEGRRPLNYFKNQIPNLDYWLTSYLQSADVGKLSQFMPVAQGIGSNAEVFVKLFSRLDPLAAAKRSAKKPIALKEAIEGALAVFSGEMHLKSIKPTPIEGPPDFQLLCWREDIYAIFTNLVDNSIYWMAEKQSPRREISVMISTQNGVLEFVDYRDTGPGIEPDLIRTGVIFEPEFTTKSEGGTGLGLAIAGEAANRNGLELSALESETGAYFRLQPKTEASK